MIGLESGLGMLAGVTAKSCLVLTLAVLTAWFLRSHTAAARHSVWLAALIGIAVLPLVTTVLPVVELVWLPANVEEAALGALRAAGGAVSRTPETGLQAVLGGPAFADDTGADEVASGRSPRPGRGPARGTALAAKTWTLGAVAGTYLLIALALLARLGVGVVGATRLGRRASPVDTDGIATSDRCKRPVAVVASDDVRVPVTFGLLRPLVVVPATWTSWPAPIRRNVMLHEIAHVDRFDWVVQLFARAVCALYWFNPLVWFAARHLYVEAERACDERVLEAGSSPADYAAQLLLLSGAGRAATGLPMIAIARPSDLLARVKSIHQIHRGARSMSRRSRRIITLSIIAGATLIGAAELTSAQQAAEPAEEQLGVEPAGQPAAEPAAAPAAEPVAQSAAEPVAEPATKPLVQPATEVITPPAAEANSVPPAPGPSTPAPGQEGPLLAAAARGDAAEVERLLADGADPNVNLPGDGTPLIQAASYGHLEVVELLLEAGADPNRVRARNEVWRGRRRELMRTPLTEAARRGHLAVVQRLLDAGADVDAVPAGDASALMEAAEHGYEQIVRLLVARGADVDRAIPGDGTPLIAAARGGNLVMLRLLVDRGADVNRPSPGDGNALIAAVRRGDREMVRFLVENGADPFQVVPGDDSAVVHAAESGDEELLRLLLDARR